MCRYAVEVGEKRGCEVEAVWMREQATVVEAELGEISRASQIKNEGMKIRVIRTKATGSVFTYRLDKDSVKKAVESALAQANASRKDEQWDSLPSPRAYARLDVWDPHLEKASAEEMTAPVVDILQMIPRDLQVCSAATQLITGERACVNSSGLEHADRGTQLAFGMAVVGVLPDGMTPAFEKITFTRTHALNPQEIASTLIDQVNLFKKPETATSGESTVILSPEALQSLFRFTLFKALSGDNVARGKSLFGGKEGKKVANEMFTLHDNGIHPQGFNTREMDDEGVPCQDTPLIERGVLRGFLWNDYWGKRMGTASTGNAHYDGRTDEVAIQQTTMVVTPGDHTMGELCTLGDGYLVLDFQGAHGSNPESGDFSVVCTPAYRIRNGDITGGVVGMMLSGNIFSLIQNVDAVENTLYANQYTLFPHVRFKNVTVIAK